MKLAIQSSYESARAEIWQADAIEFLERLQPNSISLIVSSPPYFMGKEYDRSQSPADFVAQHEQLFPLMVRAIKPGGSLCWQVGHHVRQGRVIPLDALVYSVAIKNEELILRNRIVWMFNHGVHCSKRFSGRHETILWFTKGNEYKFDLDAVRVPQKYPGKRHYKGPRKGEWSGNPLGKKPWRCLGYPECEGAPRREDGSSLPISYSPGPPMRSRIDKTRRSRCGPLPWLRNHMRCSAFGTAQLSRL